MSSERDIVERLRDAYDQHVVCHCGESCKDHGYHSGHDPVPLEDDDDKMLRLAAATIELLRSEVNARRDRDRAFRQGWDKTSAEHLNAVERAVRATDAAGALGKEAGNGK